MLYCSHNRKRDLERTMAVGPVVSAPGLVFKSAFNHVYSCEGFADEHRITICEGFESRQPVRENKLLDVSS